MRTGSIFLLVGGLLLAGCSQNSVIANRDQVVVEGHSLVEASTIAQQRCTRFGRRAYFENEGRSTHAFTCRAPHSEPLSMRLPEKTSAMAPPGPKKSQAKKIDMKKPSRKMSGQVPPEKSQETKSQKQIAAAKPVPLKRQKTEYSKFAPRKRVTKTRTSEIKQASKGTIWVQVASGGKKTGAKKAARKFLVQNADVIGTSSFTIQQANLGNAGTVYRTRVGPYKRFASADNACQALKSRKLECLVVIR
jgi:hypothetical protein